MSLMCVHRRALGGVAIVAVASMVLAPQLLRVALPLVIALCPLSMGVMGWIFMRGSFRRSNELTPGPQRVVPIDVPFRTEDGTDRGAQVAGLRYQLEQLKAYQEALAQQLAVLEAPRPLPYDSSSAVHNGTMAE